MPALDSRIVTYSLTPRSRVLLEKLTGFQLVKKFPALYGTLKFTTAFTSARQLSLTWASSIQSIPPHLTSWRSILILSSHLRLRFPSGLLPSGFSTKTLHTPLLSPIRATCPAHLILLDLITNFHTHIKQQANVWFLHRTECLFRRFGGTLCLHIQGDRIRWPLHTTGTATTTISTTSNNNNNNNNNNNIKTRGTLGLGRILNSGCRAQHMVLHSVFSPLLCDVKM